MGSCQRFECRDFLEATPRSLRDTGNKCDGRGKDERARSGDNQDGQCANRISCQEISQRIVPVQKVLDIMIQVATRTKKLVWLRAPGRRRIGPFVVEAASDGSAGSTPRNERALCFSRGRRPSIGEFTQSAALSYHQQAAFA
jgi:hypothetical protein